MRLLKILVLAAIATPLVGFAAAAWYDWKRIEQAAVDRARRTADIVAEHALKVFESQEQLLDRIDDRTTGLSWAEIAASPDISAFINQAVGPLTHTEGAAIAAADGRIAAMARAFPAPALDVHDQEYFVGARQAAPHAFVSRPIVGRISGKSLFRVSRARKTADGVFDGIVVASLAPDYFIDFYRSVTAEGESVTMVRDDGTVLVREPQATAKVAVLSPQSGLMSSITTTPARGMYRATSELDRVTRIHAYRRLDPYPVYVSFGIGLSTLEAEWRRNLTGFGVVAALASLLLAAMGRQALGRARRETVALRRADQEAEARAQAEAELRRIGESEAESALKLSEWRFRTVVEAMPHLVWETDEAGRCSYLSPQWAAYTGLPVEDHLEFGWQDVLHPADRPRVDAAWSAFMTDRVPFEMEFRLRGRDGSYRWFQARATVIADDAGPVRVLGTSTDIHDRFRTESALREETRRLEILNRTWASVASETDLQSIVQRVIDGGVELTGAQFGVFFYKASDDDEGMLYCLSGAPHSAFSRFPMPRPGNAVFSPTFLGKAIVRSDDITRDSRFGQNAPYDGLPPGHLPVRSYLAVPVTARSGAVIGGLFYGHAEAGVFDARTEQIMVGVAAQAAVAVEKGRLFEATQREIAERRQAEELQRLLVNELCHRVKNTLATVQAITNQTLRSAGSKEEARAAVGARIAALARAHDILTGHRWEGADLAELVAVTVEAHGGPERVRVAGPDLRLPPRFALSLALALHELGTNAVKYGSLSVEDGHVEIRWELRPAASGGPARLHLVWRERGGPPVQPPTRRGFGTLLIERGLAAEFRGEVGIDYAPDGLVCTIDAPLPMAHGVMEYGAAGA
ncbi:HWE histidine kinase domain-containing protein [Arenibaculum pallidiluteum]|uniref:HWE histidine kinase domain-containing protein n=1 Tax=Arenibaculum pallidiluteum TaxID=2812559 RepID=UPI001A965369|nr:HWE histidine kinase domain-containing protein [Arenibaculum pallidiluteum]